MLQVEHRVAEVDVAVDLPYYHVDCVAVDLPDCLILIIKVLTERDSHGDPIDAEKKVQRPIGRGQEVLSLNNIHQGVTAKGP
ncbi:unnamed protein product [Brassica rapa subsp. trilocularis]